MSDSSSPLPSAGWYADPENAGQDRWWNGTAWSDQRRPTTAVPAIPPAPPSAHVPPVPGPVISPAAPYADARPDPYGAPPAPAQPYAAYGYARPANPNVPAIVGFIISMAGILLNLWLVGLVGIAGGIVSAVGLARANRLTRDGVQPAYRGLALAGVIVGFGTSLLTALFYGLILIATLSSPSYYF